MSLSSSLSSSHLHDIPKVRILVVGDSGVGKSSLVHNICYEDALVNPRWTVGCSVDVKLFEYRARGRTFFLEFFDVGGSKKYQPTREMFFNQVNGIILVFDVTNRKSYHNLRKWIREIVLIDRQKAIEEKYIYSGDSFLTQFGNGPSSGSSPPAPSGMMSSLMSTFLNPESRVWKRTTEDGLQTLTHSPKLTAMGEKRRQSDLEWVPLGAASNAPSTGTSPHANGAAAATSFVSGSRDIVNTYSGGSRQHSSLGHLPVLVVGNKMDAQSSADRRENVTNLFNTLKDLGIESIFCSARSKLDDDTNTKLDAFFDKVIERRFYRADEKKVPAANTAARALSGSGLTYSNASRSPPMQPASASSSSDSISSSLPPASAGDKANLRPYNPRSSSNGARVPRYTFPSNGPAAPQPQSASFFPPKDRSSRSTSSTNRIMPATVSQPPHPVSAVAALGPAWQPASSPYAVHAPTPTYATQTAPSPMYSTQFTPTPVGTPSWQPASLGQPMQGVPAANFVNPIPSPSGYTPFTTTLPSAQYLPPQSQHLE